MHKGLCTGRPAHAAPRRRPPLRRRATWAARRAAACSCCPRAHFLQCSCGSSSCALQIFFRCTGLAQRPAPQRRSGAKVPCACVRCTAARVPRTRSAALMPEQLLHRRSSPEVPAAARHTPLFYPLALALMRRRLSAAALCCRPSLHCLLSRPWADAHLLQRRGRGTSAVLLRLHTLGAPQGGCASLDLYACRGPEGQESGRGRSGGHRRCAAGRPGVSRRPASWQAEASRSPSRQSDGARGAP